MAEYSIKDNELSVTKIAYENGVPAINVILPKIKPKESAVDFVIIDD